MQEVYITAMGTFLPNDPISNEMMEDFLGRINGKNSVLKERILKQNGIKNRYYAMDMQQQTTHSNAELAALAIASALNKSTLLAKDVELLATGTTQGDLPVPGFASMVHALTNLGTCELASFQSVCSSGVMALKDAYAQIKSQEKNNAVVLGSEVSSRLFKSTRFESQNTTSLPFDAEFLRWMLSDGAGAFVVQNKKSEQGLSLKIEWIDIKSYANQFPVCMFTGKNNNQNEKEPSWLDYPDYATAANLGVLNLKQDVRQLNALIQKGVAHYFDLINQGKIVADQIDWMCCHYSSEMFKQPIKDLMQKGGGYIADEKWFSNLSTKGNTGAASIFIMLEELFYSDKLKQGQQILCMVPESGRFITSFMLLSVEDTGKQKAPVNFTHRAIEAPELVVKQNPATEWLVRALANVWITFEGNLLKVPIVQKIHNGTLSLEEYKLLLMDLRQQVIDGSQWIARAASNIDIRLFELRSAFIIHTATEHKDYQMLEKNYVMIGGSLEEIQSGQKNIGGAALSAYIFNQASKQNPIDLLGAMFIIEGIGKRLAAYWGEMIQVQLGLKDNQVSFFTYHGKADENHFHRLEEAINHPALTMELAQKIAQTAKTVAKLYQLQLEELGNY